MNRSVMRDAPDLAENDGQEGTPVRSCTAVPSLAASGRITSLGSHSPPFVAWARLPPRIWDWYLRSYARSPGFELGLKPLSDPWVRTAQVMTLRGVLDYVKKFLLASGTGNGRFKPFDQLVASLANGPAGAMPDPTW